PARPRHGRRGARRDALRRPEAARRARARPRGSAPGPRPRRLALQRRRGDRAAYPRPAPGILPGADDDPRRPPADDGEGGRSHRRARRREGRRDRRPREPRRARWGLRGALPRAGARGRARGHLMPSDIHGEEELGKAYDLRILRRLWVYVRPYHRVVWLALLLSPVQQRFNLVQPYLLKIGIDRYVLHGDAGGLRRLGWLFAGAIVGEFAAYYWQQYLTMVVAQRSLSDLRVALFARVQRFPMRFFDRNPIGPLASRLTTDVDVLQEMFAAGAMTIVLDVLGLVGIVAFMLWINWRLAVVSLALLPVMIGAIVFFRRMARRTYRMIRER